MKQASPADRGTRSERLLLLADSQPLIVDLAVRMDGADWSAVRQRFLEDLLRWADADNNGATTWEELLRQPIAMPMADSPEMRQFLKAEDPVTFFDTSGDQVVQIEEMDSWLGNMRRMWWLRLRQEGDRSYEQKFESAVWELADRNRNGRLERQEWNMLPGQLRSRDFNQDGVITFAELAPAPPSAPQAMATPRADQSVVAVWLSEEPDWDLLYYELAQRYGSATQWLRDREPERFKSPAVQTHEPFNLLGRLLRQAMADLTIHLDFPGPTVRLDVPLPGRKSSAAPKADGGWTMVLGNTRVQFRFDDELAGVAPTTAAARWLQMWDQNQDGLLTASETAAAGPLAEFIQAANANGDEGTDREELVEYLRRVIALPSVLVHVEVGHQGDAWLAWLDEDGDGQLGERELAVVADRLQALDEENDGVLWPDDVPSALAVHIARRGIPFLAQTPGGQGTQQPASPVPRWFQAMDVNGDGAISELEFLGTRELFLQLDKDRDGLLTLPEVTQTRHSEFP